MASVGCMKNDGVPVEASVALIFLQMMPDLPTPIVTTRPLQVAMVSTAATKDWSRCGMTPRIAAASTSRTRLASTSAGCSSPSGFSAWRKGWVMGADGTASVSCSACQALLRQERVIHHRGDGHGDARLLCQTHDRAELGVELGGFAIHDVALQRGGGRGCECVVALPGLLDGVIAEGDAAGGGECDDFAEGAGDDGAD